MICVKTFTRPMFLGTNFYAKKRVYRDNNKFASKERKCFKIPCVAYKLTDII